MKILQIKEGAPYIPLVSACTYEEQINGLLYENKIIDSILDDIRGGLISTAVIKLVGLKEYISFTTSKL